MRARPDDRWSLSESAGLVRLTAGCAGLGGGRREARSWIAGRAGPRPAARAGLDEDKAGAVSPPAASRRVIIARRPSKHRAGHRAGSRSTTGVARPRGRRAGADRARAAPAGRRREPLRTPRARARWWRATRARSWSEERHPDRHAASPTVTLTRLPNRRKARSIAADFVAWSGFSMRRTSLSATSRSRARRRCDTPASRNAW